MPGSAGVRPTVYWSVTGRPDARTSRRVASTASASRNGRVSRSGRPRCSLAGMPVIRSSAGFTIRYRRSVPRTASPSGVCATSRVDSGRVPFDLPQGRRVGRDAQGVETAAGMQPGVAELHQPGGAVLVPYGEDTGPAPAGRHDLDEQLGHRFPVPLVDQEGTREPAQRVLYRVPEQLLGLLAPQHDPPVAVQQHRRDTEQIHQSALRRRRGDLPGAPGFERVRHIHPGTPSACRRGRAVRATFKLRGPLSPHPGISMVPLLGQPGAARDARHPGPRPSGEPNPAGG